MLQTATAHVYSHNADEKIEVKLLFDNGSRRTYITEDLKKRLSFEVEGSENLNLNTFGSEQGKKMKCDRVRFMIALDNDSEVEISALTYPTICSPLGSHIDLHLYPHQEGLQLTDRSTNSTERIDILIGADFYHNIVIGEVLRGGFGPIAISSKLGWLLSGPVASNVSNHDEFNDVASHLIIDSTANSLSWAAWIRQRTRFVGIGSSSQRLLATRILWAT